MSGYQQEFSVGDTNGTFLIKNRTLVSVTETNSFLNKLNLLHRRWIKATGNAKQLNECEWWVMSGAVRISKEL